jgi:iron complex outermembrane receptor protein
MEITFKKKLDRFAASINIYHTWFADFIYAHETGEAKEGLDVFQYRQKDARFYGAEIELGYVLFEEDYEKVSFELSGDIVNAKFSGGEYIPRIPAASAYIAVDYQNEYWGARMGVKFTDNQNNITEHELKTDGYSNVSAEISYRPFGGDGDLTLRLQAKNLFNSEMRQHTSFLKDLLPMPGRNIRFSLNYSF